MEWHELPSIRPDVRNAFRPKTTSELLDAFHDAQEDLPQSG